MNSAPNGMSAARHTGAPAIRKSIQRIVELGGSAPLQLTLHRTNCMPDLDISTPSPETVLWRGHTSQWVHFWYYFFCALLAAGALAGVPFTTGLSAVALVVPICMWMARWWITRTTLYELTTQRLKVTRGILNRRLDELELFRVKDYVMDQPLFLRLAGLGNITLVTSDATTHRIILRAIADVQAVRETLRTAVQSERDRKRVREIDVGGENDSALS
jgi:membrane protein YdbS with pleckstrin-like domain